MLSLVCVLGRGYRTLRGSAGNGRLTRKAQVGKSWGLVKLNKPHRGAQHPDLRIGVPLTPQARRKTLSQH